MSRRIRALVVAFFAMTGMLIAAPVPSAPAAVRSAPSPASTASAAAGRHRQHISHKQYRRLRRAGYSRHDITVLERHHAVNKVWVTYKHHHNKPRRKPRSFGQAHVNMARADGPPTSKPTGRSQKYCATASDTVWGLDLLHRKMFSFTLHQPFCWRVIFHHVPYRNTLDIVSYGNAKIVNEKIYHHTLQWASVGGWQYQKLDSTGQLGPTRLSRSSISVQRRGWWHYSIGWGPLSVHNDMYPTIKLVIKDDGGGWPVYYPIESD